MGKVPSYRLDQVRKWVFEHGCLDWSKMTNLPQSLRHEISQNFDLVPMELLRTQGSSDTTRKLLWKLRDNQLIESVLLPATEGTKGVRSSRLTLCVSTQVGCAIGCTFCASGLDGLKRNLTTGEIVGQILMARNEANRRIDNLVFMGMGEPLANLPALLPALDQILSPRARYWRPAFNPFDERVSSKILELAKYPAQIRLAISLHGGDDETRQKIMPINERFPLDELLRACEQFIEA